MAQTASLCIARTSNSNADLQPIPCRSPCRDSKAGYLAQANAQGGQRLLQTVAGCLHGRDRSHGAGVPRRTRTGNATYGYEALGDFTSGEAEVDGAVQRNRARAASVSAGRPCFSDGSGAQTLCQGPFAIGDIQLPEALRPAASHARRCIMQANARGRQGQFRFGGADYGLSERVRSRSLYDQADQLHRGGGLRSHRTRSVRDPKTFLRRTGLVQRVPCAQNR